MHRRLSIKDESVICGSKGFTVAKVGKRVDRRGGGGGCSSVLERVRAKELQRKVEAGVRRGDEGHEGDGGCLSRRVDAGYSPKAKGALSKPLQRLGEDPAPI